MSEPARRLADVPDLELEFSEVDDPEAREAVVQFLIRLLTAEPQE